MGKILFGLVFMLAATVSFAEGLCVQFCVDCSRNPEGAPCTKIDQVCGNCPAILDSIRQDSISAVARADSIKKAMEIRDSLHKEDFKRILKEPKNSLIMQYTALLETEGVKLEFAEDALDRISFVAEDVNSKSENIGARRLHTIMEKVLSDINFDADEHKGETIVIDSAYVDSKLGDIVQNEDLSRYIL